MRFRTPQAAAISMSVRVATCLPTPRAPAPEAKALPLLLALLKLFAATVLRQRAAVYGSFRRTCSQGMRAAPTAHARNLVHWADLTLALIAATAALLGAGLGVDFNGAHCEYSYARTLSKPCVSI